MLKEGFPSSNCTSVSIKLSCVALGHDRSGTLMSMFSKNKFLYFFEKICVFIIFLNINIENVFCIYYLIKNKNLFQKKYSLMVQKSLFLKIRLKTLILCIDKPDGTPSNSFTSRKHLCFRC